LSHSAASNVANNGAEKLMATAPARGIRLKAIMIMLCATACVELRPTWSRSRLVWNTARPVRGRMIAAQTKTEVIARMNRTSSNE